MDSYMWFVVDVSFVWASGLAADHREFPEMAFTPDLAKEKTLEYLEKVGATEVVVHSVVPEGVRYNPEVKAAPKKVKEPVKPQEPVMKRVSLF